MNLYQGCAHACAYCDGRAERYHLDGDFEDVAAKSNAVEVLAAELSRAREPGFALVGGGVSDAWQPAEAECLLAREVLALLLERGLPVHALTKSALVGRDLDLLADIGSAAGAILSFSVATVDETVRERFEPGASPISERLRLMGVARDLGLGVGAMALPVLPGISDQPEAIAALVAALADAGAQFVCFGGLTLRPGRQTEVWLEALREHDADLVPGYERLYREQRASGAPDRRYSGRVRDRFTAALDTAGLPARAPRALFSGRMPRYAELGVLLEHREVAGDGEGLGAAGWAVQGWARGRLREDRRRTWQEVDAELVSLVRRGELVRLEGVTARAATVARELAAPWLVEPEVQGSLF
jgi:DNA repair photolyase